MNKIHRIVWSAVRGAFVVAHELANSHGKPSSTLPSPLVGEGPGERGMSRHDHPLSLTLSRKGRGNVCAIAIALAAVLPAPTFAAPPVNALPTNGQIVGGAPAGTISTAGNAMTITQNQQRMIANWDTFNIGKSASVHFAQPGGGVALNRVTGSAPSEIFGKLSSTGSVFLINPNGVLFGRSAQVDVGALVASTMKISDSNFMAGNYAFTEGNGSVINQGNLSAVQGGYIALLAPEVRNEGLISASMGSVVLAGAEAVTLSVDASGLHFAVDKGAVKALVDNKGMVEAEGGQVILSARAANDLATAVINHSGTIEAKGLVSKGGKIMLEADHITLASGSKLDASGQTGGGTVLVGGEWQGSGAMHQATTVKMEQGAKIDVSANTSGAGGTAVLWSDIRKDGSITRVDGEILAKGGALGGDGGKVETSGHTLKIGDSAKVSTGGGQWLLDPYDFTIGTGGDITASTLQDGLAAGDVNITTTAGATTCSGTGITCAGNNGSAGDITVASAITWASDYDLTLSAYRNIAINANITASGSGGKLSLYYGQSSAGGGATDDYTLASGVKIGLKDGQNFSTRKGTIALNLKDYTVISTLGAANDATTGANTLQGLAHSTKLAGNYALGADIDASSTSTWNVGDHDANAGTANVAMGFTPIGTASPSYTGVFTGLGHTVDSLYINRKATTYVGLFGKTLLALTTPTIRDIGVTNATIEGGNRTGTVIGTAGNTVTNIWGSGSVTSAGSYIGGLVGDMSSNFISNSYSNVNVTSAGGSYIGGLAGQGAVVSSYATGTVTTTGSGLSIGGLNGTGSASYSYATGAVNASTGSTTVGGLMGNGSATNSYATGNVIGGTNVD